LKPRNATTKAKRKQKAKRKEQRKFLTSVFLCQTEESEGKRSSEREAERTVGWERQEKLSTWPLARQLSSVIGSVDFEIPGQKRRRTTLSRTAASCALEKESWKNASGS